MVTSLLVGESLTARWLFLYRSVHLDTLLLTPEYGCSSPNPLVSSVTHRLYWCYQPTDMVKFWRLGGAIRMLGWWNPNHLLAKSPFWVIWIVKACKLHILWMVNSCTIIIRMVPCRIPTLDGDHFFPGQNPMFFKLLQAPRAPAAHFQSLDLHVFLLTGE